MTPLAIDLFCGLGGWTEGLLAEGYRVVGFDIERHVYGEAQYPAQLVLQDVLTIHGSQFKDAALIVASPPCQAYSYRAMPWKKAKALPPPDNSLFEACFRIQREACEASGRYIPLVVENVCGAQKWVGRARWHFGSFYLWGDVPALMPITRKHVKVSTMGAGWYPPGHPKHVAGLAFNGHADRNLRATKNQGGSWFAVAHNTTSGHSQNPDGRLNGDMRGMCSSQAVGTSVLRGDDLPVSGVPGSREGDCGIKCASEGGRRTDIGKGAIFTSHDCGIERVSFGSGVQGGNAMDDCGDAGSDQQHARSIKHGGDWFGSGANCSLERRSSSKSSARKAASAHIAKIPLVLARHIARAWLPEATVYRREDSV